MTSIFEHIHQWFGAQARIADANGAAKEQRLVSVLDVKVVINCKEKAYTRDFKGDVYQDRLLGDPNDHHLYVMDGDFKMRRFFQQWKCDGYAIFGSEGVVWADMLGFTIFERKRDVPVNLEDSK